MKRNLVKRIPKHVEVEKNKKPKWLEFLDRYQSFFSLSVAILAIVISIYAWNDSNKTSADTAKQLEKSEKKLEEISKLIDKQIESTNQQIEVLQKQSELSKQQIKDNILSGAPILRISSCFFNPHEIWFEIRNHGIRSADVKGLRIFVAYKTNKAYLIEKAKEEIEEMFCTSGSYINPRGNFKNTFENKDKMYIVIDLTYYDEYSGEEFSLVNYFYDGKFEYGKEINITKENEKKIVFESINKYIDNYNINSTIQEKHIELESRLPNAKEMLNR